jgi:hypothetical protein
MKQKTITPSPPSSYKPWFNLDCKFAQQNYRKLKRKKKLYPWQITSEEVNNAEKHYKKTFRQQSEKTQ